MYLKSTTCLEENEDIDFGRASVFGPEGSGLLHLICKPNTCLSLARGQEDMAESNCNDTDEGQRQVIEGTKCELDKLVASDEYIETETAIKTDDKTSASCQQQGLVHATEQVKANRVTLRVAKCKENRSTEQSFCDGVKWQCELDLARVVILLLLGGLKIKTLPKMFLLTFLILYGTAASPTSPKSGTGGIKKYSLIDTSQCGFLGLRRYKTCEQDDSKFDIFVKYCGYDDQCGHGYKPVCAYDDKGQMLHFCSPAGLTCPRGVRRRVVRVDVNSGTVFVQEENCPNGRSHTSNCYDPCIDNHKDIKGSEYDVSDPDFKIQDKNLSESNEDLGTEMEKDQNSELNQTTGKPSGIQRQNLEADELSVGKDWHVNIVVVVTSAALLLAMIGIVVLLKHNPDMSKQSLVEQI